MGHTKYSFDENFFKKNTPESFYIAGFLAADGWLYIHKRANSSSYIVGLSLKEEDKYHIEIIQKLILSNHALYKRIIKNSNRNSSYKDSISYTLQITSKELFEDLKRFNLEPNKSLTYKMPDWIKNHKYINYFLLGYFDGDGSLGFDKKHSNGKLRKTPQARLHLRGTKNFLQDFHSILYKNCNIPTEQKCISNESGIGSLQYTGNKNVYSILKFLYNNTKIHLNRKYSKYIELQNITGNFNDILS